MSSATVILLCVVALLFGFNVILLEMVVKQRDEIAWLESIIKICGEVIRDGNKEE